MKSASIYRALESPRIAQFSEIVNPGDEATNISFHLASLTSSLPLLQSIFSHLLSFSSTDMVAQEALSIVVANL